MGSKLLRRCGWLVGGVVAVVVGGGVVGADLRSVSAVRLGGALDGALVAPLAARAAITARGRLQPAGGVIRIAGPSRPAVVETLRVHEGNWVEAGQVIAVFDGTAVQHAAVERIGLSIGKQGVFGLNPASDADARVVEVHIRLDDATRAATLTNLQVDVDLAA